MYYALKRNADGIPDPKTGENTAISAAFRFTAKSAFVVDPPVPIAVEQPPYPGGERAMTERKRFLLATKTGTIEPEVKGPNPDIPQQTVESEPTPAVRQVQGGQ